MLLMNLINSLHILKLICTHFHVYAPLKCERNVLNDMSVVTLTCVGEGTVLCLCVCYHKIAVQAQLSQNLNKLQGV